jgi:hypothetical protein
MPDARIAYDDVHVLEDDGSGFTCLVLGRRVFVGKYVPLDGTTVARRGDRGRLVLPREFAEEQRLPTMRSGGSAGPA